MIKCFRCTWRYACEHPDNELFFRELAGPPNPDHAGVAEEKPATVPKVYPVIYKTPPKASFDQEH